MPRTAQRSKAEVETDGTGSRPRIEEKALELFAAHGFRGTSVKEVMTACGLTQGALYNHFQSKDDLLLAVIDRADVELRERLDDALQTGDDDPVSRLFRFVQAMSEYAIRHPRETKVSNVDYAELPVESRQLIIDGRRRNRGHLERILEDGLALGVFRLPEYDGKNDIKVAATAIANVAVRLSETMGPRPKGEPAALARFHAELAVAMVSVPVSTSS